MRRFVVPVMVGLMAMGIGAAKVSAEDVKIAASSPLDGTKWTVKVTPDEESAKKGEKAFDDTLMFKNNKVTMSACVKKGFKASEYTATQVGQTWNFSTEQTSTLHGKSEWKAEITGDVIKGTLTVTKKDGSVLNYTFDGKKKAASLKHKAS